MKGYGSNELGRDRHYNIIFHIGTSYVPVSDETIDELKAQKSVVGFSTSLIDKIGYTNYLKEQSGELQASGDPLRCPPNCSVPSLHGFLHPIYLFDKHLCVHGTCSLKTLPCTEMEIRQSLACNIRLGKKPEPPLPTSWILVWRAPNDGLKIETVRPFFEREGGSHVHSHHPTDEPARSRKSILPHILQSKNQRGRYRPERTRVRAMLQEIIESPATHETNHRTQPFGPAAVPSGSFQTPTREYRSIENSLPPASPPCFVPLMPDRESAWNPDPTGSP